eukprot:scaffold2353_cov93-Skeletonema_dohrnii-CCMP3373.AAC.10
MQVNIASSSINHGAALLAAPIPMKKSSGNDMLKDEFEMILAQSRDRYESLVDTDKDVAAETPAKAALIRNDSEELQKEERDAGDMWDENQPLRVELVMMAPPALSRSGSAMSHASCKPSNSLQEEVHEKKAPVALYRSRTDVSQKDKKSSPSSPVDLSRSRTATPQISNERSAPTFSDMMKLVALSRAKSFQLNKLPKVAQPESIEEVATIEEVPSVEALSVASHPISITSTTSSSAEKVPADEEPPAADFATAVEAPAADEEDEEFAAVEVVEVVEVEPEPEDKFAGVMLESKSSFKKSKLSKMKGLFTKKSQKEQN